MGQPNWAKDHVKRYKASNGVDGHIWDGLDGAAQYKGEFPTLLLTTTGRKTGKPRTTPLIYGRYQGQYVVIASQGGRPHHPGWYHNIQNDPKVELQVVADIFHATAKTVFGSQLTRLWQMMVDIYPPYEDYKEKASQFREIPMVVLSPD